MMERRRMATPSIIPTFQRAMLVEFFNLGPGKVGREDPAIGLSGARAADGPPLAHPHSVARAGPGGHEPGRPCPVLRDGHLEHRARQPTIALGSEHVALLRAGDARV